jgi:predicted Fe-Mo cluster-binding NifX family protein
MDKAAQLAQRLGHAPSKVVINIINSDVMNCPISASDFRNKDAAKGVSIAEIFGKTIKKK